MSSLFFLFAIAFLSATLLPGGSEAWFLYQVSQGEYPLWVLLLTASFGNTLGGMTNWFIGFFLQKNAFLHRLQQKKYQTATRWIQKYGLPVLLLAWLPVIGDILCIIAGFYRLPFFASLALIFCGKFLRYLLLAGLPVLW